LPPSQAPQFFDEAFARTRTMAASRVTPYLLMSWALLLATVHTPGWPVWLLFSFFLVYEEVRKSFRAFDDC